MCVGNSNLNKSGIARIAEVAWLVNERTENIGARRLYTVMERLLETISFDKPVAGTRVNAFRSVHC